MTLLDVSQVSKSFPGVRALDQVDLVVGVGEVHALLGENGAGKSTLIKILSAAHAADAGTVTFAGQVLDPRDAPLRRQQLGIATIYQEFNLFPELSVAENMYLGREPRRLGLVDWSRLRADAQALLNDLGLPLNPDAPVRGLTVAEQQMVEIAKAMTLNARLIIMDEPTAALSGREVDRLHAIIAGLKARSVSVIYVSHRLGEVKAMCDRYTVMRDGRFVASGDVADVEVADMVRLMVGRHVEFERRKRRRPPGAVVLKVEGVTPAAPRLSAPGYLRQVSFAARGGEIVGLAGLVGAGRTDLARLIFGADPIAAGRVLVDDKPLRLRSPRDAIQAGIMLVPEDRKQQGCFLDHSIRRNLSLPSLKALSALGQWVDERAERDLVETYRQKLRIKMADAETAIGKLSGGNQQKVLLGRAMALTPKVLIVDEPTRGIDIGAKAEVHQVLSDLADLGVAVVVISSELAEVMAVSDRIVVFREGVIVADLDAQTATEEGLMAYMATGTDRVAAPDMERLTA
ncbi:sugar ABC transporter ATP-binding protein [Caulobacter vibrioides]|uniref:Sugar ABC transporter, ATP-binding protein n=2 Tax=Caulobacter vibrioides TaxID=155892 RepID=Q9A9V1_CAUVC|nr:sugar ABC transporter ATP-binding protein [Caulobacter vibrioides]YP_002516276.1 inositol transport ATP-binding protein IatA [Caulobacter vibrioides NA1000]AAK22845.1 sugar ABC transporter, ATP-binding protein [Caulobacter vibrioides CB15]ACL94368.1 inositol transport ATP-binding protein IatA [Caulobacter vibrioides NA1000]ATC27700.1 sugar ABC transporter ATP-binding protein [Caulobacter vibrioides]QXZ52941.1 sugar ABC transporter ATP-binding protein [Caulobacter vibrioides]